MTEQAVAAEQITKAAAHLTRQIATVSRAMSEQTAAAKELTTGVDGIRVQSDQAARAATEQARTMKEMAKAADLSAREIRTRRHRQQATVEERRASSSRSSPTSGASPSAMPTGVSRTRGGTADLIEAGASADRVDERVERADRSNGRSAPVTGPP